MTFSAAYTTGATCVVYDFQSEDEYADWSSRIKELISRINDDGAAGAPRVPKYRRWLHAVDMFRVRFGYDKVPADIEAAYAMDRVRVFSNVFMRRSMGDFLVLVSSERDLDVFDGVKLRFFPSL
mmetsp:Transcript_6560/g.16593  ORF Transcript_6560/g.16593 Transcript_6560/m.16593 type:complete len:124 (+) Transcript_6560:155-526(+)